ncbi:uncharacterized protein LOC117325755 [Pecten maximus]|uniref:uncharacterized protein LOC117325755 n=1 Tax=Pecten maximus TaxID=6579 RepID=UPI0014590C7F|nr:uncharacterized protein LOC117325755 [Pecten maximus]
MDKLFNSLYDRLRPSPTVECHSCMETLLPHSLPHGNVTEQQMEESLSADYYMLAKVVAAMIRMREDCEQFRNTHRHIESAEIKAKQLMCQVGHSLSILGGDFPCEPLNPVLMPWCQIDNCLDWTERNYLVMDKLISTSQAMKSKFRRVVSSHVIRCTN